MTVSLKIPALLHMKSCKLAYRKHRFKEICCLRSQGRPLGFQNFVGFVGLFISESSFESLRIYVTWINYSVTGYSEEQGTEI